MSVVLPAPRNPDNTVTGRGDPKSASKWWLNSKNSYVITFYYLTILILADCLLRWGLPTLAFAVSDFGVIAKYRASCTRPLSFTGLNGLARGEVDGDGELPQIDGFNFPLLDDTDGGHLQKVPCALKGVAVGEHVFSAPWTTCFLRAECLSHVAWSLRDCVQFDHAKFAGAPSRASRGRAHADARLAGYRQSPVPSSPAPRQDPATLPGLTSVPPAK